MKRLKNYNRIMVLGTAAANEEGELYFSAPAKNRCDRAAEAYYGSGFKRVEASILITGGYGKRLFDKPPISREAKVMADYLMRQYGVPSSAFLLEDESTDTQENFDFSIERYPEVFEDVMNEERKLAIVSHKDHLKRAFKLGSKALGCFERQLVLLPTTEITYEKNKVVVSNQVEIVPDVAMAA